MKTNTYQKKSKLSFPNPPERHRFIRECPKDERPQERMIQAGPEALSDAELIGVIIRSGSDKYGSVELASRILQVYDNDLKLFRNADVEELTHNNSLRGLGIAKSSQIVAAIELGRRIFFRENTEPALLMESAFDAGNYLVRKLKFEQQEKFCVLLLNTKNEKIGFHVVSTGTLSMSLVHPREVFLPAIRAHAAKVILSHNHRETCKVA